MTLVSGNLKEYKKKDFFFLSITLLHKWGASSARSPKFLKNELQREDADSSERFGTAIGIFPPPVLWCPYYSMIYSRLWHVMLKLTES
jgi:hypothetical protein